jgi:FkbM family methyltransferase
MFLIKRVAAHFPDRWQAELKRIHFSLQISKGTFLTDEPEYKILHTLIKPGDWVVDIGANVGHYTRKFSELVGPNGRVLAFEPVPNTFALLSANTQLFKNNNVTLINAAVSDKLEVTGMDMPKFSTGLTNYYMAHLSPDSNSELSVMTLSLDSLNFTQHIALVKIDAEGHEAYVLAGMQELIKRDHPVLIIETDSEKIIDNLSLLGYTSEKLKGSPNILFKPVR